MSIREVITWIDVTERLPDDTRNVLVESPGDDDMERVWMGFYGSVEEQWYSVGADPMDGVVRWAEMPTGEASTDPLIPLIDKIADLQRERDALKAALAKLRQAQN